MRAVLGQKCVDCERFVERFILFAERRTDEKKKKDDDDERERSSE